MGDVAARLRILEAKEAIRWCIGRYFDLCDVPREVVSVAQLAELFTPRATWEGIGPAYANKFGRVLGRHKVAAHVASYLPPVDHFLANAHLLGSEQLRSDGDRGTGQWLMQQLATYTDHSRDLLCARITVDFVVTWQADEPTAQIARFQTERLYHVALPADVQ